MAATPEHAARVLGLSLYAQLEDVKRVRREMAFKYHPDRCEDPQRANRHMSRINAAADTLTAFIKSRPRPNLKTRATPDRDRAARQASPRAPEQPAQRPNRTRPQPDAPKRAAPQADAPARSRQPAPRKTMSRKEADLIRFASSAYARVLDHIGQSGPAPSVDLRILKFQTAC